MTKVLKCGDLMPGCDFEGRGETEAEILDFQEHEFTKHGACAGVDSADDYFTQARLLPRMNLMCSHLLRLTPSHGSLQACGLASGPLGLIRTARVAPCPSANPGQLIDGMEEGLLGMQTILRLIKDPT